MKIRQIKIKKNGPVKILLLIVFLLVGFIAWKYYHPDKVVVDSASLSKSERDEIIKKIGTHIVLPSNEEPTLATVSDPEQLKKYPFFVNAQKGDKVLIYSINKKAILYRPDGDKIVEIAPIITQATPKATASTATTTKASATTTLKTN